MTINYVRSGSGFVLRKNTRIGSFLVAHHVNPLLPETYFLANFEINPNIGSYYRSIYRCCAHRNLFDDPFLI